MRVILAAPVLLAIAAAAASANPGGGGGGGGGPPPSVTLPDFDPAAEYRSGIEALQANRFADARRSFKKVLSIAPTDANTNFLAGMAEAGLNDLKAALKYYEKAVKADGKLVVAHQELAITSAKLGDRKKAEASLARLRKLEADCAGTCEDAAKLKEAIAAVEAAIAAPPQARLELRPPLLFASADAGDSAYLEAVGLINEGKYEQAVASLQRARSTFGAHPDILTYLGFAHRQLGRFDLAEAYYNQALAAAPDHRGATEYYGELKVERGDLDGARKLLARLESLCDFGCAEADELRQWIAAGRAPGS